VAAADPCGQMDGHDEANRHFSRQYEHVQQRAKGGGGGGGGKLRVFFFTWVSQTEKGGGGFLNL